MTPVALAGVLVPERQVVSVVRGSFERVLRLLMDLVGGPMEITRTVLSDPIFDGVIPYAPTRPAVPPLEKEDEGSGMNIGNENHSAFLRPCQHPLLHEVAEWVSGWRLGLGNGARAARSPSLKFSFESRPGCSRPEKQRFDVAFGCPFLRRCFVATQDVRNAVSCTFK